eukprot:6482910-Amphidinium_carterae.1
MAGVSSADLTVLGENPTFEKIVKWAQLSVVQVGALLGVDEAEVVSIPLSTFAMFSVDEYEKMVADWGKETLFTKGASPLEMARARLLRVACITLSGSLPRVTSTGVRDEAAVVSAIASTAKK